MNKGKSAFITFRPHPNDNQLFEDFLIIFLPILKTRIQNYVYVVERDNTPEKHFHCVINDKSFVDNSKVKSKISCKPLQRFNKFLSINTETNNNIAHQTHFIGKEDKIKNTQYYIGYCYKEDNVSRRDTNLPACDIQASLEYYNSMKRLETNETKSDVKYIKANNVHRYINEFRQWEGDDFVWVNLHRRMIRQGYSFIQLTSKQFNYAVSEIKYMEQMEEDEDIDIIDSYRYDQNIYRLRNENMKDIYLDLKFLVEYTKTQYDNLSKASKQFLLNFQ